MSFDAMGKCEQHPQCTVPGDGVCPSCLQKKLTRVWRGESHSDTVFAGEVSASMTMSQAATVDPIIPKEALAIIGSIASIAKRTHHSMQLSGDIAELNASIASLRCEYGKPNSRKPHPSFDVRDGGVTLSDSKPSPAPRKQSQDIEGVMKDWTALHAKRRSQGKPKGVTIADESPMVEYSRASLPLVDRIAKETALRVIKEVGDDVISVEDFQEDLSSANRQSEDNIWEDNAVANSVKQQEKSTVNLSPVLWHSKIRSKWVKGLGSPLTSSSKVFPSKSAESVRKPQAQASPARSDSRLKSSRAKKLVKQRKALSFDVVPTVIPPARVVYDFEFTSEAVIEGMPDEILKPEDMNQRLRMSYNTVLLWLQVKVTPCFHPNSVESLIYFFWSEI